MHWRASQTAGEDDHTVQDRTAGEDDHIVQGWEENEGRCGGHSRCAQYTWCLGAELICQV